MYINAIKVFPFFIRSTLSKAKLEKVVNPPQIPVLRNNVRLWLWQFGFNAKATISPIKKQPKMFTAKVLMGNSNGSFSGNRPITYRIAAPHAPPRATRRMLNIDLKFLFHKIKYIYSIA